MQEVLDPDNLEAALQRVQANKGSSGTDGMSVNQLPEYLGMHWQQIKGSFWKEPTNRSR